MENNQERESTTARAKALAKERYPARDTSERGYQPSDYVTDGQQIGFTAGYLACAAEGKSRGRLLATISRLQRDVSEASAQIRALRNRKELS